MSITTLPARTRAMATASLVAAAVAGPLVAPAHAASTADSARKAPDVVITKVTKAPASARPGTKFNLAVGVRNRGRAASGVTPIVVRLSKDAIGTRADRAVGAARAPRLRAGQVGRTAVRVTLPAAATAATYRLFACTPRRCSPVGPVRVLGTKPAPKPLKGSLHGDLYLVDSGKEVDGPHTKTWQHDAHLSVQMTVSGPDTAHANFASTGSQYGYVGAAKDTGPWGDCTYVRDETRSGGGRLAWNDDPDHDEIGANFVRTDMSSVRVTTYMRYDDTESEVVKGNASCARSSSETHKALDVESMKLEQVGRTATTVTYKVTSIVGAYNTTSEWDRVDGTLVLDLD